MTSGVRGPLIAKGRTAEVYAWQGNKVLKLFFDVFDRSRAFYLD